ncbi:zinc finger protein 626 isoform X2 [Drosophila willistoni]|uniref:zinc finger protein 626 isoform X2 n=1 Tax=Drosophila willistoni TaxID=7260 RepID=UPI000C26CBCC|nr:zinc finger protein 626 isoform X2 [Drosophila willistoni]
MTTTTEIHYNISAQTCRVCLETPQTNEAEVSLCLQDEIEYNDLKVELWQLLEAVSKCTRFDPIWPTQMCQNCTRRLIVAYEFMREVEKSQQILQELYEQEKLQQDDELSQNLPSIDVLQVFQIDMNDIQHQTVVESEQVFPNDDEYAKAEHQQEDDNAAGQSFLFKCESCPQVFDESNSLERHTAVAHSQTTQEDAMQTCPYCSRIFKHQDGLRRHMLSFHPVECNAETTYERDSLQNFRKTKLRPNRPDRLSRPMRSCRQETIQCQKQVYLKLEDPLNHQKPVNKPHPYKCGVCGMDFKSGALLTVHRNNMSHYNYEKVNYGDPFGEIQKRTKQMTNEKTEGLV